jgi:hypothetical protein
LSALRLILLAAAAALAACAGPDAPGQPAAHSLTLDGAASRDEGIVVVGIARAKDAAADPPAQLDQVELTWQPLDPTQSPLILLASGCAGAGAAAPCAGERPSHFVFAAHEGIYALDHLAVKLGPGIRVRDFRDAERTEFVLFPGAIVYLGDFTFDPATTELTGYTRDDAGALAALARYGGLSGPVEYVMPTPPGAPRAPPLPIPRRAG